MATISFYAGEEHNIANLSGSGLGFYGLGFGYSVSVGEYQDTTWITNAAGSAQGPQVDNIKWTAPQSGSINGATAINLLDMPNYLATLNARFTHSSAIKTQNVKFRVYDRVSINNDPSGVLCKVAELVHPSDSQSGLLGSGSSTWYTPTGSSVILDLISSPGISGLRPNGSETTQVQHDWYLAISASPNSIGSKLFAGYLELEYL